MEILGLSAGGDAVGAASPIAGTVGAAVSGGGTGDDTGKAGPRVIGGETKGDGTKVGAALCGAELFGRAPPDFGEKFPAA
jgi:hypothetical protein